MPSPAPRPRASVVIPVCNRVELTWQCLTALRLHPTDALAEIIVVDDASTDGTDGLLAEQRDVRVFRNPRNEGFAKSCNRGAHEATAPYVCFLHNDTVVKEGWLDALLDAAQEPFVGAVGGRLLFPDGRIQHAGVAFVGGVPDHPYRYAAANDPAVMVRRELDMVTGACLLVPRDLFLGLGGFDPAYVNGLEDVDLCLRIREGGAKVVYEPRCVVTHYEGQTGGRVEHLSTNMKIFEERFAGRISPEGRLVPLNRAGAVWRGDFGSVHSLAVVNAGVSEALEAGGLPVHRVLPDEVALPLPGVGIAQQWPPSFEPPSEGPFVLYQPYELGRVPAEWVEEIRLRVDEVWTPSAQCRDAFVVAGVDPSLVRVVPNGVDLERFTPGGPARGLGGAGTTFLFVGGAILRKGVDLLLEAWAQAFGPDDDVRLVLKCAGGSTFYAGQTLDVAIAAQQARDDVAPIDLIEAELPYDELPAFYRGADVLVQPYRAEGFCLPALEALACGTPVIVTAGGPTDAFVSDECAWRVSARRVTIPAASMQNEFTFDGDGFLLDPDLGALVAALRDATDPARRDAKGAAARSHAERFSLEAAAVVARGRIEALSGRLPIRATTPATVPGRRRLLLAAAAEWDQVDTWFPPLQAYAQAFTRDSDTTLVLPAADEQRAVELVRSKLAAAGIDAANLADVALAAPGPSGSLGLELAADAVIHLGDHRPARARRVVPPDPDALRALLPTG